MPSFGEKTATVDYSYRLSYLYETGLSTIVVKGPMMFHIAFEAYMNYIFLIIFECVGTSGMQRSSDARGDCLIGCPPTKF